MAARISMDFVKDMYYLIDSTGSIIDVNDKTSSTITISWSPVQGATSYNVYIAPEPNYLGDNSKRKLMVNLDSSITQCTISSLAAAVDTFVRVEAVGTSEYGDAHAKTYGGPRSNLIFQSGKNELDRTAFII